MRVYNVVIPGCDTGYVHQRLLAAGHESCILMSYWYFKNTDVRAWLAEQYGEPLPRIMADSGGFSADSQGVHIDVDEYGGWVEQYRDLFDLYLNLDVIHDAKGTARNQRAMEAAGFAPVPVFHTKEDFRHLAKMVREHPYICIGGMVPYLKTPKVIVPWMVECFKRVRRAPTPPKVHGLGATSWAANHTLDFHSVDSSTWCSAGRFGSFMLYDPVMKRFRTMTRRNAVRDLQAHQHMVTGLGFTMDEVLGDKHRGFNALAVLGIAQFARDMTEKHERSA